MIAYRFPLRRTLGLLLLITATGSAAQTPPAALTQVPGLNNVTIPNPSPAPRPTTLPTTTPTPVPTATPTPRASPTPVPTLVPTAHPSATPRAIASTVPATAVDGTPTPVPSPTDATDAVPVVATVTPAPQVTPTVAPSPLGATSETSSTFVIVGGALIVLALSVAAWFALGRRRTERVDETSVDVASDPVVTPVPAARPPALPVAPPLPAAPPVPTPSPPPSFLRTAPVAHAPRAWIELDMRPVRAGTNVTSAAVDYEIMLHNVGEVGAIGIRLNLALISAAANQDAVLDALFAAPVDRPVVAPFDLAAGEQVVLGGMAMSACEALHVVSVQGRALFVPMFALDVRYDWDGGQGGQTANAWVIGIERGEGAKMQPFRLDTGPRMYDTVGQRLHSFAITT